MLTGQRRVGKSCILKQLQIDILKENPQANILYINMEYEEVRGRHTTPAFVGLSEERGAMIIPRNFVRYS